LKRYNGDCHRRFARAVLDEATLTPSIWLLLLLLLQAGD
jgi:hypothetical protein